MIDIKTYSDWNIYLEKYASGDDSALVILQRGTFDIDAGTRIRFYDKLQTTYVARKKNVIERFSRDINIGSHTKNSEISILFRNINALLLALKEFTEIKAIPDELRQVLQTDFKEFTDDLKNRFSKIYNDNIEVLMSIKSLGIGRNTMISDPNVSLNDPIPVTGRKIIF